MYLFISGEEEEVDLYFFLKKKHVFCLFEDASGEIHPLALRATLTASPGATTLQHLGPHCYKRAAVNALHHCLWEILLCRTFSTELDFYPLHASAYYTIVFRSKEIGLFVCTTETSNIWIP